jgi:hypothetical protein
MLGEIGNSDALLARELPDGGLQLLDGHLRAGLMPDEEVPVLILDLNEAEADKLLLTLDPLASMASTDSERLSALLETWRTDNPAIQAVLENLRAQERLLLENLNDLADPEPHVDKSEELRCKWRTAIGQLWQAGPHRLICADARDLNTIQRLWEGGQKFRLLRCDPPYGIDYAAKNEFLNRCDRGNRIQRPIANDELGSQAVAALFRDALKQALGFAANGAACYASVPSETLLPHFIGSVGQVVEKQSGRHIGAS